jgi:glyoxylase-like metal-dependent hydrolase (beta-lactamase superfamily II)
MRRTPISAAAVRRLHYGYVVVPPGQPDSGQPLAVTGFLVPYPGGTLLFDTGMSPVDDEAREQLHPRRRTALEALAAVGATAADIDVIANCHLHFDHAGGNYLFPGTRILVQDAELAAAREPDFTYPAYAFDYPNANFGVIDGEADVGPGLRLVPTPGHTPGHQSLLVDTDEGRWLLAGQASTTTWAFGAEAFAARLAADGLDHIGTFPEWMPHLREWGVERAYFAHDLMVWHREPGDLGHPVPA